MASESVQAKIDFQFVDVELLHSALQAAHRGDDDTVSHDGNRGLARVGLCVMDMVETHNTIIVENGTKRDIGTRNHWSNSKRERAKVCETLGIDKYIVPSVRQQHENPSSTVLSNTLCAIIGAAWLDLEKRNESALNARGQVLKILRRIDDIVADSTGKRLSTADERTSAVSARHSDTQSIIPGGVPSLTAENQSWDPTTSLDFLNIQWADESQYDMLSNIAPDFLLFQGMQTELDLVLIGEAQSHVQDIGIPNFNLNAIGDIGGHTALANLHSLVEISEQEIQVSSTGVADPHQGSSSTSTNPHRAVIPGKRKNSQNHRGRPRTSSLHYNLLHEELDKLHRFPNSIRGDLETLLDDSRIDDLSPEPSQVGQLRLLYLAIGSCQSLIELKKIFRIARATPSTSIHSLGSNLCPTERLREICRLDSQEALCVLARRYHVVKLFETELNDLRQDSEMIVETISTFGTGHRTQAGNPAVMQEAALTEGLLYKIRPDLKRGSSEFRRVRGKLSQLRKLAKVLRMLIEAYGFGVLALLPCGPPYSELTITDYTLVSITERRFRRFSDLVYRQQGPVLKELSKIVEPALTAFLDGNLASATLFPIEMADVSVLEGLPKGSPELFEYLLGLSFDRSSRET